MTDTVLQLAFIGADRRAFVERAITSGLLPSERPTSFRIDQKPAVWSKALAELVATKDNVQVTWESGVSLHSNRKHDHLLVDRGSTKVSVGGTLALVRDLPFTACTTGPLDFSWWEGYDSRHGWALILKGDGHRLVSPRVIERGPWRRVRDERANITLLQFHDLAADADTALQQARPGHALLDFAWSGGHFLGSEAAFRGGIPAVKYKPSFYDKKTHTSVVLVQERDVPRPEMGVAAGTRVYQVFPEPVERVAFVYMDEAVGRRQLADLWLYGLEVRVMTADGERRIDQDYEPPRADAPAWVRESG